MPTCPTCSPRRPRSTASYPEHERDARTKGIPTLGSGRIFPVTEESITCDPIEIPAQWPQIGAMDFGINHPFAAVASRWIATPTAFT